MDVIGEHGKGYVLTSWLLLHNVPECETGIWSHVEYSGPQLEHEILNPGYPGLNTVLSCLTMGTVVHFRLLLFMQLYE